MYIAAIQSYKYLNIQTKHTGVCNLPAQGLSEVSFAFPADTAMWEEEMKKSKQMKEENI